MRIGILHGIHEDIQSLKEALLLLQKKNCDKIACVGDIIGYSVPYFGFFTHRDAHECIKLVKKHCDIVVAGNHDYHNVKKIPKITEFNYPTSWYTKPLRERARIAKGRVHLMDDDLEPSLEKEDIQWLKKLPEYYILKGTPSILFSHFNYPNLVGDSRGKTPTPARSQKHITFLQKNNCQIGACGHDCISGITVCTKTKIVHKKFGTHKLPNEPFWFFSSWVGQGTFKNGVTILDTNKNEVEVIPLNAKPHKIPKVFQKKYE